MFVRCATIVSRLLVEGGGGSANPAALTGSFPPPFSPGPKLGVRAGVWSKRPVVRNGNSGAGKLGGRRAFLWSDRLDGQFSQIAEDHRVVKTNRSPANSRVTNLSLPHHFVDGPDAGEIELLPKLLLGQPVRIDLLRLLRPRLGGRAVVCRTGLAGEPGVDSWIYDSYSESNCECPLARSGALKCA